MIHNDNPISPQNTTEPTVYWLFFFSYNIKFIILKLDQKKILIKKKNIPKAEIMGKSLQLWLSMQKIITRCSLPFK